MSETSGGLDPSEWSAFAEKYLTVTQRFREVAIDNHIDDGNLDDLNYHASNVQEVEQLLRHYDPPVVMSIPTPVSFDYGTISAQTPTFAYRVMVFVEEYDEEHAIEYAAALCGNIVQNVLDDRSLDAGTGNPVAREVVIDDFSPDFTAGGEQATFVKFCEVVFNVEATQQVIT